jgi:4-hydroxybenzoate polyprenyltransferase
VHPGAPVGLAASRLGLGPLQPQIIESPPADVKSWMKLLRVHQWMKNVLVFVPLLTAHKFDLGSLISAAGAFLAFSFTASATYIQNDLVDIEADRKHPSKQHRPLAAGIVPIHAAMMAAVLLLVLAFALALAIGLGFATVLAAYLALTIAYTFSLKRKMLVDVIVLAALYTIRVFGGAAAIAVPVSEWLLGFSMFIFTSLALIKRYIELAARVDAELPNPSNRNYRKTDLDIVAAIAAASGFNAVTVFALYISSEAVQQLYRHPKALWLVCPILMYWLGRILMMAHRRQIDDDPVLFALNDWNSFLAFGLIGAIIFCSI